MFGFLLWFSDIKFIIFLMLSVAITVSIFYDFIVMWPSKLLGPAFIWMNKLEQFHGVWSMKSSLHRDVSCWTIKFLWVGWSQVIYLTPRHVHPGTSIFVCLALQKGWDLGSRIFGLILTFVRIWDNARTMQLQWLLCTNIPQAFKMGCQLRRLLSL